MDIWVGSVVGIQRVWRKSPPVIRRKEELLRFLARKFSSKVSFPHFARRHFRRIWNQRFAPNPCRNIVSSPGLQSLQLVISHLAQLRVTHSPRSGHEIPWALGFRSARIRSLRSTTLRLACARRNVAGFSRYVQYELQYLGLLQHAWASGRQAQIYESQETQIMTLKMYK